ncbi:MAG: alkyl/aryl-sulfatase [Erysipelotrichaceae bacterium]
MAYTFSREAKDATVHTKTANENLRQYLNFDDKEDFELATRGLLLQKDSLVIKTKDGTRDAWNMDTYQFLKNECPDTANPSLWRISQLNMIHGLFEVVPGIYQVRGYDICYITFIKGNTGWIVMDPITADETSRAAKDLLDEHFGEQPISAVIYTHGHKDHYAGAKGIIDEADVLSGKIDVYAPENFLESAISENIYAGQAMGRRAMYVYGSFNPREPKGNIGNGIGMTAPIGISSLIAPTKYVTGDETMIIDGLEFNFIMAPETEAPAEMMFYLPAFKALCTAELTNASLHNIYTIRGAEIRDAKAWAYGINKLIHEFGAKTEVVFMTHHWPRWENKNCIEYLENQRDLYKYLHDQTLNLANQGFTPDEIGEMVVPPAAIDKKWYSRGYHGTLSHNARGIFTRYLGFWDGNPSNLNKLPTSKSGAMYVDVMGGKDRVLEQAEIYFNKGEYRFVAELLNNLVFADPQCMEARMMLADTLEQLGYQAENGTWRNSYLTGAFELRNMSPSYFPQHYPKMDSFTLESISGLTMTMMLEFMAIKLDVDTMLDKEVTIQLDITDTKEKFLVEIKNCVLNFLAIETLDTNVTTLSIEKFELGKLILNAPEITIAELECKVVGDSEVANAFAHAFERFEFWFNIIEP